MFKTFLPLVAQYLDTMGPVTSEFILSLQVFIGHLLGGRHWAVKKNRDLIIFSLIALSIYNSHTIQSTHLKCRICLAV